MIQTPRSKQTLALLLGICIISPLLSRLIARIWPEHYSSLSGRFGPGFDAFLWLSFCIFPGFVIFRGWGSYPGRISLRGGFTALVSAKAGVSVVLLFEALFFLGMLFMALFSSLSDWVWILDAGIEFLWVYSLLSLNALNAHYILRKAGSRP